MKASVGGCTSAKSYVVDGRVGTLVGGATAATVGTAVGDQRGVGVIVGVLVGVGLAGVDVGRGGAAKLVGEGVEVARAVGVCEGVAEGVTEGVCEGYRGRHVEHGLAYWHCRGQSFPGPLGQGAAQPFR